MGTVCTTLCATGCVFMCALLLTLLPLPPAHAARASANSAPMVSCQATRARACSGRSPTAEVSSNETDPAGVASTTQAAVAAGPLSSYCGRSTPANNNTVINTSNQNLQLLSKFPTSTPTPGCFFNSDSSSSFHLASSRRGRSPRRLHGSAPCCVWYL
jgi:hypothetical protein